MELDNELISKIKIVPIIDSLKLEDISDDEYFSEKYFNYISNSRLGKLKKEGAKAFFEGFKAQEYNPSFQFGTWIHELFLQPESFELVEGVYPPTAKAGLMAIELFHSDGSTPTDDEIKVASNKIGYYKDKLTSSRISELRDKCNQFWRDKFIYDRNNPFKKDDKERLFVDEKSYITLTECLKSITENKEFTNLMNPDFVADKPIVGNEKTILLDVEITIPEYEPRVYKLKSKLDNFVINTEENTITVNDLKTTSKLAKDFNPVYFSYQREIGMYSYLLKLCAKKFYGLDNPIVKGNFLVVSTIPEYNSLVYPMDAKLFKQGFAEFKYLLRTAAYLNIVKGYEF